MRAVLAILLTLAAPAAAQTARVIDGDGLSIDGASIRLWAIDAPELRQDCERGGKVYACGRESAYHLRSLVEGRAVECRPIDRDRYGRAVAQCWAGGVDLGAAQVEAGWAVAYRRYSVAYVPHEERARAAGLGIWAGTFERPEVWRADRARR